MRPLLALLLFLGPMPAGAQSDMSQSGSASGVSACIGSQACEVASGAVLQSSGPINIEHRPEDTYALRITSPTKTVTFHFGVDGRLGLGTTSPCSTCTVHVAGTMNITGALRQGSIRSCATGTQTDADGLFSACVASDKSLKRDIRPYVIESDAIDKLKPVAYRWKDANRDTRQHIGFVAQDVEKVLPSAVVAAGYDLKGIDPNALISALVLELQALRRRVKALEK